ncbi:MAG TPA: O-antigen ligase family protein [Thermoanaerobaculia bacterium]|nr:O-antigen ligase family protein [Thermoanaerobaculia bacterium]
MADAQPQRTDSLCRMRPHQEIVSTELLRGSGFWLFAGHLVALFGLALSNLLLGLTLLVSPWTGRWRRLAARDLRPLLIVIGAYVALLLAAVAASYQPLESVRETSEIFGLTTVLLALIMIRGAAEARLVTSGVILLGVLESLVGLAQLARVGAADLAQRIQGTFSHYMTLAGVLLIADLLLCARLVAWGRRAGWWWLALLPINLSLFGSLTRSAWVGLAAGLLALLLLSRPRLLLFSVPAVIALFLVLPRGPVVDRVASTVDPMDTTNYDRLCMAYSGLLMVKDHPLLGQGPRMVRERYELYRVPTAPREWVPHLHNSFLQLAAERGVPALIAYLALMGLPWQRAMRSLAAEGGHHGPRADLLLGVLTVLIGFNVAGLFENNWGDTEVQRLVLFTVALPFVVGRWAGAASQEPLPDGGAPRVRAG